jgi:DNA-binding MarR family transcriptional regulator
MSHGSKIAPSCSTKGKERFTDEYLPYLLAQASAIACAHAAPAIRGARLNAVAWRILATLNDEDCMTIGHLSRVVLTQQPRVTQVVGQLEKKELVVRNQSKEDRRRTLVSITDKGRQRIRAMFQSAKENEQFALRALNDEEFDQLKGLLRRLVTDAWLEDIGPVDADQT